MPTQVLRGLRIEETSQRRVEDRLAVEAPLHLTVNGAAWTTTMRTPDADQALARGLLFTEGVVPDPNAAVRLTEISDPETGWPARIDVVVPPEKIARPIAGRRSMLASSSCGVCGVVEPADINLYGDPIPATRDAYLDTSRVPAMLAMLTQGQKLFDASGGTHAAAIFGSDGALLAHFEDVGRHNAVDKAIGSLILSGRLSGAHSLFVSGRVSYEIVYKTYRASIPILLAVSAPTSMAVETAERMGVSLAAFCRDARMTVYTHSERVRRSGHESETTQWPA